MLFTVVLSSRTLEGSTSSFRISNGKRKLIFSNVATSCFLTRRSKCKIQFAVRQSVIPGPFTSEFTFTNFTNIPTAMARCSLRVLIFESTNSWPSRVPVISPRVISVHVRSVHLSTGFDARQLTRNNTK